MILDPYWDGRQTLEIYLVLTAKQPCFVCSGRTVLLSQSINLVQRLS